MISDYPVVLTLVGNLSTMSQYLNLDRLKLLVITYKYRKKAVDDAECAAATVLDVI